MKTLSQIAARLEILTKDLAGVTRSMNDFRRDGLVSAAEGMRQRRDVIKAEIKTLKWVLK